MGTGQGSTTAQMELTCVYAGAFPTNGHMFSVTCRHCGYYIEEHSDDDGKCLFGSTYWGSRTDADLAAYRMWFFFFGAVRAGQ